MGNSKKGKKTSKKKDKGILSTKVKRKSILNLPTGTYGAGAEQFGQNESASGGYTQ